MSACLRFWMISFCLAATFSDNAGGQSESGPQQGRYRALILSVQKCGDRNLPELTYPEASAKRLAEAMQSVGYRVTHLKEQEVTSAAVVDWISECDKAEIELGLIAFTGHGVQRDGAEVFLTHDADQQLGGIELAKVSDSVTGRQLPMFGVFDCCRTGANAPPGMQFLLPPEAVAPAVPVDRQADADPARGLASRHGGRRMVWLFGSQPGDIVPDVSNDLITLLAKGLTIDSTKRFRAAPWHRVISDANASDRELSVLAFVFHGYTAVLAERKLVQLPTLTGPVSRLDEWVLAHSDPPGPGPLKPLVSQPTGGIDILDTLRLQHGSYFESELYDGLGLKIRTNPKGNNQKFRGGYFANRSQGVDTTGKAMFARLNASTSILDRNGPKRVSIGIDAKFVSPPTEDSWLNVGGVKQHFSIPTNKVVWCRIDLIQQKTMNYVGFSDLPPGVSLSISRLVLADREFDVAEDGASPDLLSRWWLSTAGRADDDVALNWSPEVRDNHRVIRIGSGPGWMGGAIGPSSLTSRDDRIRFEIENLSTQEATVFLEAKQGYSVLGSANPVLPPGVSTYELVMDRDGLLDFLAITAPSQSIRILKAELIPRDPILVLP